MLYMHYANTVTSSLNHVQDHDACVFSHVLKHCSAVTLGLKSLVPQGLLGIQRPTEKIQGVQGGAGGNSVLHPAKTYRPLIILDILHSLLKDLVCWSGKTTKCGLEFSLGVPPGSFNSTNLCADTGPQVVMGEVRI